MVITGKNGQGKSSVLDSILFALGGKDALKDTPKPIREGQSEARVELDLGEYKVVRTWNSKGTTKLEVLSKDGARFSSPQSLLDEIVGRIAFDPLAFASMKSDEQKQLLLDVLGLTDDVEKLQNEYKEVYEERRMVGRELQRAKGYLESLSVPENAPASPVDTAEVSRQLRELEDHNRQVMSLEDSRNKWEAEIKRLKLELSRAEDEAEKTRNALAGKKYKDTSELESQLQNASQINHLYQAGIDYQEAKSQVEGYDEDYKSFTDQLSEILARKEELIAGAKLPISGLNIDADGVTYNGIPFSQLSSAKQLKVSLSIAMAMNPKLRVMRIMDGSLLDSENMKVIQDLATAEDYQVWLEVVDQGNAVGILIEDGKIKV